MCFPFLGSRHKYNLTLTASLLFTTNYGGGHWGILEIAKRKKNSSKTAKPKNKIGQNRKPHTKLYTQIGPNREKKIGKTKNHIGYQNRKTATIFYENRKPYAKKWKIHKPHWTPKPKNRSLLTQKPINQSKNIQNRKTENPNAPLILGHGPWAPSLDLPLFSFIGRRCENSFDNLNI